jgi:hypothetical protein
MLTKIKFAPGIDKQDTAVGADGRWVDSDNVRFRYGLPEKVGGWQSLLTDTAVGVARKMHAFVDQDGNRYVAIGTDKFLLIYFEGQLYDITPTKAKITTVAMSNADATKEISLTFSAAHNLEEGDIIYLDNVTVPVGVGLTDAAFEGKLFQVTRLTSDLIAVITGTETTTGVGSGGTCDVTPYERVGPAAQSYGYGFGVTQFGGTVQGSASSTLNAGITSASTTLTLVDSTAFTGTGTVYIGDDYSSTGATQGELATYTGNTSAAPGDLTTVSRSQDGTTAPATTSGGVKVQQATKWSGWGEAADAATITLEPGLWSLSNYGDVLIATIANGKTFSWDSSIVARLSTPASQITPGYPTNSNPTATRVTLISPTTRHLIHLGTETTLGSADTQDDMFIRFSADESINEYTVEATNTAGTQRLQDGTKIVGAVVAKENILVWTDNALYAMKFVGAPFTFGFEQVGTNCGLIGQNAAIEIDGVAYWMSNNGFFSFDGTVNSLPCAVEDYVFDDCDTTKGQQVNAGINNLFTEVTWWYPTSGATYNDRYVVFNYGETNKNPLPMGNWYTGTNTNSIRTTWIDSLVYPKPYATAYDSSTSGTYPVVVGESGLGRSVLFEHEIGTDQVNPDGSTTVLTSFIESFSFSLQPDQSEVFLAMRRFLPNFRVLQGNNQITIGISDYPADTMADTTLSPFTITSTTDKVDTRARGRYANLKIENTGISENWRFGTFQVDIQPDGRR